ncbi:MAG: hypothetical protein HQK53_10415 [Oligoflexia bacterium]|nr:hypothetical protein [Oligoflexia bacterium]
MKKILYLHLVSFLFCCIFSFLSSHPCSANTADHGKFASKLQTLENFNSLAAHENNKSFVKFLVDWKNNQRYFQNTQLYPFHLPFIRENMKEYENLPLHAYEDLLFGTTNKIFSSGALYYFENLEVNGQNYSNTVGFTIYHRANLSIQEIQKSYQALKENISFTDSFLFIFEDKIFYNSLKKDLDNINIRSVLYSTLEKNKNITYNTAKSYGHLKIINRSDFEKGFYTSKDILIFEDFLPLDIGPLSGVISTNAQTPHSHVVLRTINQNIPNIFLSDATNNELIKNNLNKLVEFKTFVNGEFSIRGSEDFSEGQLEQLASVYFASRVPILPPLTADISNNKFLFIHEKAYQVDEHNSYGAKSGNFHLLDQELTAQGFDRERFKHSFLVPFFYYNQHLGQSYNFKICKKFEYNPSLYQFCKKNAEQETSIKEVINFLVNKNELGNLLADIQLRKDVLSFIRKIIEDSPLDTVFESDIKNEIQKRFSSTERIRFRSSSNAEDLPGISGAGIYESKSGCLADEKNSSTSSKCLTKLEISRIQDRIQKLSALSEQNEVIKELIQDLQKKLKKHYLISDAITKVYASMWSEKAFLHRDYYRITHLDAYMGMLVHDSSKDEQANGVGIIELKNKILNISLVLQNEDFSITNPEIPFLTAENVLFKSDLQGKILEENIFTYSNNVIPGERVLSTNKNYQNLVKQIATLRNSFNQYSQYDIEFIWDPTFGLLIKQIRPLVKILPPSKEYTVNLNPFSSGSYRYQEHNHGWNSYNLLVGDYKLSFTTPEGDDSNPSRNTTRFGWRALLRFNQFNIQKGEELIHSHSVWADELVDHAYFYYCRLIQEYFDQNPPLSNNTTLSDGISSGVSLKNLLEFFWKDEVSNLKLPDVTIAKPKKVLERRGQSTFPDQICFYRVTDRNIHGLNYLVLYSPFDVSATPQNPRNPFEPSSIITLWYGDDENSNTIIFNKAPMI